MARKVTIELTPQQQDLIRQETGDGVTAFICEILENRDAPKVSLVRGDEICELPRRNFDYSLKHGDLT